MLVFFLFLCESIRSLETGVVDSYEQPYRLWEFNPGPLEDQLVPLTIEPSLQPLLL